MVLAHTRTYSRLQYELRINFERLLQNMTIAWYYVQTVRVVLRTDGKSEISKKQF
jgi:hypothetical protein